MKPEPPLQPPRPFSILQRKLGGGGKESFRVKAARKCPEYLSCTQSLERGSMGLEVSAMMDQSLWQTALTAVGDPGGVFSRAFTKVPSASRAGGTYGFPSSHDSVLAF